MYGEPYDLKIQEPIATVNGIDITNSVKNKFMNYGYEVIRYMLQLYRLYNCKVIFQLI